MTNQELEQLFSALSRVLEPHLRGSEALRSATGLLGKWLAEQANAAGGPDSIAGWQESGAADGAGVHRNGQRETTVSMGGPTITGPTMSGQAMNGPTVAQAPPPRASAGIVPLRIGDARGHVLTQGTTEELGRARTAANDSQTTMTGPYGGNLVAPAEVDLLIVERRCRLKAQACELAVSKRRNEAAGGHYEGDAATLVQLNAMVAQAKDLPNCFLWTFWRERPLPDDATILTAAQCYISLAEAAAHMRRADESTARGIHADDATAMRLLAEADSALRVVLARTWIEEDRDQIDVHHWLRRATSLRRVYIERFMTMSDPADPLNAADLTERIRAASVGIEEVAKQDKAVKKPLSAVKYHGHRLAEAADDSEREEHWGKIAESVQLLAHAHVPMSDLRLCEALAPVVMFAVPPAFAGQTELLAALDFAHRKEAAAEEEEEHAPPREWSERVLSVRPWLKGGRMVVVGGERRGAAVERLLSAFELSEVDWVELSEHGSSSPMKAAITRPGTCVVLVLVRLTGHLHATYAQGWAREAGVPCAWLKAGYNPERVANDISEQLSAQLAGRMGDQLGQASEK